MLPATVSYARYVNPRFAFAVDYPTFLELERPPDNGDGQAFRKTEHVIMAASARLAGEDDTLDALYQEALAHPGVVYKHKGREGFVVSSTAEGGISYTRVIFKDGIVASLELVYDASLKQAMDPVVARVSASFRTTKGGAYGRP